MTAATEIRRRIRWRARRGLAELDAMLTRFLDSEAELDAAEWHGLERLLEAPDPVLLEWLMGRAIPADAELAALSQRIRRYAAH